VRQLQAKIGRAQDQLLTFCDYPGEVDATNNGSERKLRPCVIQRKVTNGYRAMWAAQAEADVRTTVDTARLERNPINLYHSRTRGSSARIPSA
jgi:transposase